MKLHRGRAVYPDPNIGAGGLTAYEKMLMDLYTKAAGALMADWDDKVFDSNALFDGAYGLTNKFFDKCESLRKQSNDL
jgi:hypothetical protein